MYEEAHRSPSGPGDARPTALQIIHDQHLENALSDKVILITGCSSGIGAETARALAKTGATLFLGVRNLDKARKVLSDLLLPGTSASSPGAGGGEDTGSSSSSSRVHLLQLDLSSFSSIRNSVTEFLKHSSKLNILINNGGVMGVPPSAPEDKTNNNRTEDGYEMQFGTNHLGHFLLFQLLKPLLIKSATDEFHSRVVGVTSSGHRMADVCFEDVNLEHLVVVDDDDDDDDDDDEKSDEKVDGETFRRLAYAQSKTANCYMMNEIERRYGATHKLHGLSVHPGGIFTGLQKHVDEKVLDEWRHRPEIHKFMKSPEQGAATTVLAAVGREWEGRGGVYLEDCREGRPAEPGYRMVDPGYESHIWDRDKAAKLWDMSLEMVGLPRETDS